jgi:type I restriction enzyme M protein
MAKRHEAKAENWDSVFRRLEELVLANSGGDAFEEIFRLIVAKLWEEQSTSGSPAIFGPHAEASGISSGLAKLLKNANIGWAGIVGDSTVSALTDEHLAVCVEMLSHYRFGGTSFEFMDSMFEMLVSQTAKGSKGQYFTPRHVVDLCVRILKPKVGELICDPACGSGAFLVHALRERYRHVANQRENTSLSEDYWGFDFDPRAVKVAKALMILSGQDAGNIYRLNSLLTPAASVDLSSTKDGSPLVTIEDVMRSRTKYFRGFDVILTNPPFAGEIKEKHILKAYTCALTKNRIERDALFLERCVQLLKPGGRMAIILPHNKLASEAWSYLRQWFMENMQAVAVIGLGRNTFLPHTHQKAGILVGVKRQKRVKDFEEDRILFAVSERDGKNSRGEFVLAKAAHNDSSVWERVDHDLGEIEMAFSRHCRSDSFPWGA